MARLQEKSGAQNNPDQAQRAFLWITEILQSRRIPYMITGGLAARAYGSKRPLNDIDLDIPENRLAELASLTASYCKFGPARFLDERWDLQLMTLKYQNQLIDISGSEHIKICDARTGKWKIMPDDYSLVENRNLFGKIVPIIGRVQLVAYKRMLAGTHQQIDIKAVLACQNLF